MHLSRYKSVLALPGMRGFMLVSLIARIPGAAWTTALTLSIVLDRHRGYAEAGAATAAFTVGLAVGSPLLGRAIDRRGPRPVLALTGTVSLVFWNLVPWLPYPSLLPIAVLAGALQVPVVTLVRRSLAVRVPESVRRQAYSLDSMVVELSFMVGPALAVLSITQLGEATSTLRVLGFGLGLSAAVLYMYDRHVGTSSSRVDSGPASATSETAGAPAQPIDAASDRKRWFDSGFVLILAVCTACFVGISATDVAIVAVLRGHGEISWAGTVVIIWCLSSLVGGFVHGAMPRPLPMTVLLLALGVLSVPVGTAGNWLLLCLLVIPAGLAFAPTIASTVDAVSRAVPTSARGTAMGLHSAALTIGSAIGAPLIGVVIDRAGPGWGMAVIGLLVSLVAIAAIPVQLARHYAATRSRGLEDADVEGGEQAGLAELEAA